MVISTLQAAGFEVVGAFDDDPRKWGHTVLGVPVLGPIEAVEALTDARGIIAVGDNAVRKSLAARFAQLEWLSVIHPKAYVHHTVQLGVGTVVFAGAVIQPAARVGEHGIINTAASIDHDCAIGAYAHIAPGAHIAGGVSMGEGTFMGIGSSVVPGLAIGSWSVVGAGGVVIEDLPSWVVAVGVPARVIKTRSKRA